jgi:hypothetical protein
MVYAEEPYGVGAPVWDGVAVEEIPHGLVEVALSVLGGHEERVRGLGTPGRRRLGEQGGQIGGRGTERVVEPAGQAGGQIAYERAFGASARAGHGDGDWLDDDRGIVSQVRGGRVSRFGQELARLGGVCRGDGRAISAFVQKLGELAGRVGHGTRSQPRYGRRRCLFGCLFSRSSSIYVNDIPLYITKPNGRPI